MSEAASLYRRHRPQTFDEVVGQEHVVRTLRNAIEQDRLHHAYLFVGSRGTGKTSMAKILARSLNCVRGPTLEPCGECESCITIAASTSLDVIEMDAASNRSVDDVRELRERVAYLPASGHWKVYILDEAHMLTKEAWNAFLKTLEEPPPNTVFVLATTEAHKVMPTIVDRCQRFDFQRPTLEQLAEVLQRVAAAEGIALDDAAISMIARSATGSFRDALGTLDQLVAYAGNEPRLDDVLSLLGAADADLIFAATDAMVAADPKAVFEAVERLSASGRDPAQFARDLIAHLRQLLVVRITDELPASFSVTATDEERLRSQAGRIGESALVRAIDDLSAALGNIREGDEARVCLEVALLKSAHPDLDPSAEALNARLERLEAGNAGGHSPDRGSPKENASEASIPRAGESPPRDDDPEPSAEATESQSIGDVLEEVLDLERVTQVWPAVVDRLRQSSVVLSTMFATARPVAVDSDESVVKVGFPPDASFNKKAAEARPNPEQLTAALKNVLGRTLRPVYVLLDSDEKGAAAEPEEIDEEALIERFKSEFDAEEFS